MSNQEFKEASFEEALSQALTADGPAQGTQETPEQFLARRTQIGVVPTGDRVIIRQFTPDEKIGSIIIPTIGQEPPNMGVVVAIGDGRLIESQGYRLVPQFSLGATVFFGKYAGAKFIIQTKAKVQETINGMEAEVERVKEDAYLILHEEEIMAVDLRGDF